MKSWPSGASSIVNELLLDTCALIWVLGDGNLAPEATTAITSLPLHVSAVSALEIGILIRKGRFTTEAAPALWFQSSLDALSAKLQPLPPEILFASQSLPGLFHGDPFDRVMIATARRGGLKLVTRDRAILDYCNEQGLASLRC